MNKKVEKPISNLERVFRSRKNWLILIFGLPLIFSIIVWKYFFIIAYPLGFFSWPKFFIDMLPKLGIEDSFLSTTLMLLALISYPGIITFLYYIKRMNTKLLYFLSTIIIVMLILAITGCAMGDYSGIA